MGPADRDRLAPEVKLALDWWLPPVLEVLGDAALSATLYGSGATGGYVRGWSDVDVCVVLGRGIADGELQALGGIQAEMRRVFIEERLGGWLSTQAVEAEFIPRELVADPDASGPCVTAGAEGAERREGNLLAFDRLVLARHGIHLWGAPVTFAEPTHEALRLQLLEELPELDEEHRSPLWHTGGIAWIARSIVYWRDGDLLAKSDALRREIERGSEFTGAYRIALRMRDEGSRRCTEYRPELHAAYDAIRGPAGRILLDLAGGAPA